MNDTLHFGVGSIVYAYAEDVNLALGTPINGAFTHLNTDDEIKRLISHTFQVNGFLIAQ